MKTGEELAALKKEAELTEDKLKDVTGGKEQGKNAPKPKEMPETEFAITAEINAADDRK